MPPKKKNTKKANDDWEADLGDVSGSAAAAPPAESKDVPAEADPEEEFGGGGGLMAMMKKRNKKKKGKAEEEPLEGEDPPAAEEVPDLGEKAPVEASIDDEFALTRKSQRNCEQAEDVMIM